MLPIVQCDPAIIATVWGAELRGLACSMSACNYQAHLSCRLGEMTRALSRTVVTNAGKTVWKVCCGCLEETMV